MIRQFLLCIVLCVVLFVTSCGGVGEERYPAFRESPFCAEVSGTLNGVRFSAELCCTEEERSVRYLSPTALEGLTVTRLPAGELSVVMDGVAATLDGEMLAGLWLPFSLVAEYAGELQSVQKENGTTRVTLSGEVELILSSEGVPVSVNAPNASFAILSWESKNVENAEK